MRFVLCENVLCNGTWYAFLSYNPTRTIDLHKQRRLYRIALWDVPGICARQVLGQTMAAAPVLVARFAGYSNPAPYSREEQHVRTCAKPIVHYFIDNVLAANMKLCLFTS